MGGRRCRCRPPAPSSSSPTCGSAISCAAIRWCKLLRNRFPDRPIDMLATTLCAPLADYMPGVRKAIVADLPRRRLGLTENLELAARLKAEHYGSALIMSRKWKAALAPFLAGIPERTGFVGEARFVLLNDRRYGERALPRMVDQCATLALPPGAALPASWPPPLLAVPPADIAAWKEKRGLAGAARPIVALAPGAVGPSKRWPAEYYAELTRRLLAEGCAVWVLGGPGEKALAQEIIGETPGARSHRLRPARRHFGARGRRGRGIERFRPPPRRRGARHAVDRHFRPNEPAAMGAAQSARRGHRDQDRARLPALPQAGVPARPSPLHARHTGKRRLRRDPARARRGCSRPGDSRAT